MSEGDRGRIRIADRCRMLLMVEKDIRGGMCHAFRRDTKANNKYMKDYDKNKESSYLMY